MKHNALQHQELANSLKRDVHAPISRLRTKLSEQFSDLKSELSDAQHTVEQLHQSWVSSRQAYLHAYREACQYFAVCLELGLPGPCLSPVRGVHT